MRISSVALEDMEALIPHIDHLILKACDHSEGEVTPTDLVDALFDCQMQLWVVYDEAIEGRDRICGIVVTQIMIATSGIVIGEVCLLGGERLSEWVHLVTVLEDWARAQGAAKIQARMRKGLMKHLGSKDWRMSAVIAEKDLCHGQENQRN